MKRGIGLAAMLCASSAAISLHSIAQEYPARSVSIIVPAAPGGGIDFMARVYASEFSKRWKHPAVVDNKPGATGLVGAEAAARAQPDGHTLFMTTDSTMTQSIFRQTQFDAERDLIPVAIVASTAQVCYVNSQLGVKSWPQLVAHVKANPGKLNYVEYPSTTNELYHRRLWQLTGMNIVAVPFNGQAAGVQAVLGNTVQLFCGTPSGLPALEKAGKIVVLAVTGREPNPVFPGAPTLRSLGLDYEWTLWFGLMAPAGLPPAILAKIQTDIAEIQRSPEVQATIGKIGLDPETRGPKETAAVITATGRQFKELARSFGIKPQP